MHRAYRFGDWREVSQWIYEKRGGEHSPIGTSTGQHLVDTKDVEGVYTNAEMERILAGGLGDVLVGANSGGFESLRRELLILIGDEVAAEGELVNRGTLAAEIVDAYLSVAASRVSIVFNDVAGNDGTFESGTPRLYLDFGYGLFLQYR